MDRTNTVIFFLLYFLIILSVRAQNENSRKIFDFGFPSIQNFRPKEYEGHAQTWDITQSPSGLIYIGTSEGVLEFDGTNWATIKLPNRSRVKALDTCPQGKIYCGGTDDLGYLAVLNDKPTFFKSLKDKLPTDVKNFDHVFNVKYWNGLVFFQTMDYLFVWHDEDQVFEIHKAAIRFSGLRLVNDRIMVRSVGEGFLTYSNGDLEKFSGNNEILKNEYSLVTYWKDDSLLFTFEDRLLIFSKGQFTDFKTEIDSQLPSLQLSDVVKLPDGRLVVLTKKGLFFLSASGRLLLHLDKKSGLADDNIKYAFIDREGALWTSSNFGLSRIDIHIPIKRYDEKNGIFDTVNDILKEDNTLYVSTHTGLFKFDPNIDNQFSNVKGPIPESFALEFVNNQLWVSTVDGIFRKGEGGRFIKICGDYAYKFQQSTTNSKYVFVGAINGLVILIRKNDGSYDSKSYRHLIKNDIRYMNQDTSGILWLGTNNNKLIRFDAFGEGSMTEPKIDIFDDNDGLPVSHIQINVINNEIFFSSEFGVFEKNGESFVESTRFPPLRSIVYYMYESSDQTVYALFGEPPFMKILPFDRDGNKFKPKEVPELSGIESPGLWVAYEDPDDKSLWYGMTDGVLNYQPEKFEKPTNEMNTNLNRIWVNSDSIIASNLNNHSISGRGGKTISQTLSYKSNSLKFTFGLPCFDNQKSNQFQYRLVGLNDDWSLWTKDKSKEYVELFEGKYTFEVRGKNVYGNEANIASFAFDILPPWYRTWWFLAITFILFVSILFLIVRYLSQRKLILRVEELEFQQKIQKERERISSDLHDHVGAQLTSIISGLQVTEEIKDLKSNEQARLLIDSLKEDAQTTMVSLRDSIWTLKNEAITVDKFVDHIQNYLDSQLKYDDTIQSAFTFEGNGKLELSPKNVLQLTRTIQEAIQNIVKHARASLITINIISEENHLNVKIRDNGAGFNIKTVSGEHFGIDNMKNRIQDIGGDISISSQMSKGTEIDISI